MSKDKWIKVSDKLPAIGQSVLTYPHYRVLPFGDTIGEGLSHDETDRKFWDWVGSAEFGSPKVAKPYPTHWHPLPDKPTE